MQLSFSDEMGQTILDRDKNAKNNLKMTNLKYDNNSKQDYIKWNVLMHLNDSKSKSWKVDHFYLKMRGSFSFIIIFVTAIWITD